MAPRGKTMLGSSRTVQGSDLVGYEFMMIREQGDKYAIEVRPSGKKPVVFTQSTLTDSSVVFENPKNGYPQKIGYRRDGENALSAWIEGRRNGSWFCTPMSDCCRPVSSSIRRSTRSSRQTPADCLAVVPLRIRGMGQRSHGR